MDELGHYHLDQIIYRGPNTTVWQAHRIDEENQSVLLKLVQETESDGVCLARLKHEYQLLQKLNISGVTRPLEFLQLGQTSAIAFENHQETLLEKLVDKKPMDISTFLIFALNISKVLSELHQADIVHKDIKPSNILFNPDTGAIQLLDFGIASEISRELQTKLIRPDKLEGTLAYMSPEQTGRMNRVVDYRTDFYSLGATFYQILTGQLPFDFEDPMEIVHAHIAKEAKSPNELKPKIPKMLSDIVMKLMAKAPEARYQSAYSLCSDLERCFEAWRTEGDIKTFPLAQKNVSNKFQMSQKLYGREQALETLSATIEQVIQGDLGVMMVTGVSGIGKTSLVNEVHHQLTEHKSFYIQGKYDQYKSHIPYLAISQALDGLADYLLVLPNAELTLWREKLHSALGTTGQVIIDLAPKWAMILGEQPPLTPAPGEKTQARLVGTYKRFMQVMCTMEHPMVMFLDDLQWIDAASLTLLKEWLDPSLTHYILFIGAYRSNEVSSEHPISNYLNMLSQSMTVSQIELAPLKLTDVNQLIVDSFFGSTQASQELSEQIYKKTEGNPFFINELLQKYYRTKLINFSEGEGVWVWDLKAIRGSAISDSLVGFMTDRIRELPQATLTILKYAAILGARFNLKQLTWFTKLDAQTCSQNLWSAIEEGLIQPLDDNYRLKGADVNVNYQFAHDQIQRAAYDLLTEEEKPKLHYQWGTLYLKYASEAEIEENIITIIQNYNYGLLYITQENERLKLAQLNLRAGLKAKQALAYKESLHFFTIGTSLLAQNAWEKHYQLSYDLYAERMESLYRTLAYDEAEQDALLILEHAQSPLDKAAIYFTQAIQNTLYTKMDRAMDLLSTGIQILGYPWKRKHSTLNIMSQLIQFRLRYKKIDVEALINQGPTLTDPNIILRRKMIYYYMWFSIFVNESQNQFFALLSLSNQYIKEGLAIGDLVGIVDMPLNLVFHDYKTAKIWSDAGLVWEEKINHNEQLHIIGFMRSVFSIWHYEPWEKTLDAKRYAKELASLVGDQAFTAMATLFEITDTAAFGNVQQQLEQWPQYLSIIKQANFSNMHLMLEQDRLFFLNLTGDPLVDPAITVDQDFNEKFMAKYKSIGFEGQMANDLSYRFMLFWIYEDYASCYKAIIDFLPYRNIIEGFVYEAIVRIYIAIACGTIYDEVPEHRKLSKKLLKQEYHRFKQWANFCPKNFIHFVYLIEGELARIAGNHAQAIRSYEQAITEINRLAMPQFQALFHEMVYRYYLKQGAKHIAANYLYDAMTYYEQWGAVRKVALIKQNHADILALSKQKLLLATTTANSTKKHSITTTEGKAEALDISTLLKSSQTISSELELEQLIDKMLYILIENVGAERGALFLFKKKHLLYEGEINIKQEIKKEMNQSKEVDPRAYPSTLLHYVELSQQQVVIADAQQDARFKLDPYIQEKTPKSILSTPIILNDKLLGILYFENNLSTDAFTPERIEVLQVLSAQVAISIENARLYGVFERFVPKEFIQFLGAQSMVDVSLGDHIQDEIIVLMSDIRSFTTISEGLSPADTFAFLNQFLAVMEPIITNYGGFIDKYIGDAIMALIPKSADAAIKCSLDMLKAAEGFHSSILGEQRIDIGIGLNQGELILGIVGTQAHFESTVISDAVNTTSRLESLNSHYATKLLISESIAESIVNPKDYLMRVVNKLKVKGKTKAVLVYEVIGLANDQGLSYSLAYIDTYQKAWEAYQSREFKQAEALLTELQRTNPKDRVVQNLLHQIQEFIEQGCPKNWDGTIALLQK